MIMYSSILSTVGSKLWSLIVFALIICFLIAWHELGHLLVAKKFNVYCYEYSIGFGPLVYRNKKHETHFCIRAIPLGGFVKMAGEEGLEEGEVVKDNNGNPVPDDRILGNKSCGKRALVMAAGGLMNILMALICFYIYLAVAGGFGDYQYVTTNQVYITPTYTLETLGMESGDYITKIESKYSTDSTYYNYIIVEYEDILTALDEKKPTTNNPIQELKITYTDVSDNNTTKTVEVTREIDSDGNISKIGLAQYFTGTYYEYNAFTALYGTFHFTGYYTVQVVKSFAKLFTGDMSQLSGLIGIYGTVDSVTSSTAATFGVKLVNIIYLMGAISFSLGFFNLIPFPALDGGRLVFVVIEAISKKKVNPNVEAMIHFVGIILLFALMIIINLRDIIGLF